MKAMESARLEPLILRRELDVESWAKLAMQWANEKDRPTGVVAYNSYTAQPILFGSLMAGLEVPQHLSLVTFEEQILVDAGSGRSISTCLLPEYDMGYVAVEMLLERIENGQSLSPRLLPFKGIKGATVAPPPMA